MFLRILTTKSIKHRASSFRSLGSLWSTNLVTLLHTKERASREFNTEETKYNMASIQSEKPSKFAAGNSKFRFLNIHPLPCQSYLLNGCFRIQYVWTWYPAPVIRNAGGACGVLYHKASIRLPRWKCTDPSRLCPVRPLARMPLSAPCRDEPDDNERHKWMSKLRPICGFWWRS